MEEGEEGGEPVVFMFKTVCLLLKEGGVLFERDVPDPMTPAVRVARAP